jgi:hypothetical protein
MKDEEKQELKDFHTAAEKIINMLRDTVSHKLISPDSGYGVQRGWKSI